MNWLSTCDMFSVKSVVIFVILSVVCGCEGRKLYEDSQDDEDDSMDCSDGRKIDDPVLLPFLQKLRGREMLPARMKKWVIYFDEKNSSDMFEGWSKSYLTEVGLSKEDHGVPYGSVYVNEGTNVYSPRVTPIQDDWAEFRVMYAEQLLLDSIDEVKIYINNEFQVGDISKSSKRLLQVLLKRARPQTITVLSSSCNNSCTPDTENPLLTLTTCGSIYSEKYDIQCESSMETFPKDFFEGMEASHFERSITPEFQTELPVQLKQELQNILDWLLKRIGQRMRNYMEMAFRKNKFRKTNMELYNKVNLQMSKIKGGKTFEAAKSADLIYNSLFDLNVYLNVTNTPYTFDKFHTFNLYLGYIGQFSKWQLDTTKYANFFEPLKELCLSQISVGSNLLKPAKAIFDMEEGVYDLTGVICEENILYIINGMTTINTIKSGLFDNENCDFDTVFVLAKKNLTINEDLKIPGKNLIVFAPTWIIFTEHVIDLSGKNGRSDHRIEAGQSGGDFFGFGLRFDRPDFLTLITNGGDGSKGRDGTSTVSGDQFTQNNGDKCSVKKDKKLEILAKYGATHGGPGGSAGTITLKILRNPVHNSTIVRTDGKDGRDGKIRDIVFQCKNGKKAVLPVRNLTEINIPANDIQRMTETSILELFRKIIRKNSRRLSYDVLSFYKDIWTSPIIGETLDSTLNDFLNTSDYIDSSKDFYEVTSQILHTQIKQTCNMTDTQKVLVDFALATIRMTAPAENALPSVIDITSYLKEVSNSVDQIDIEDEYFERKDKKFREVIEEANYYLKISLLPSLNRSIAETHKYLKDNADEYLVQSNLSNGRKYQENMVSNNLLRYLMEILKHVQLSLEDFVKKEEFDPSVGTSVGNSDAEKLEKKLYFYRYLRNNVTVNEMNAMTEFIQLLKRTVEDESHTNENTCLKCKKELSHSVSYLRNVLQKSHDICKKCTNIIKLTAKNHVKRSTEADERCQLANVDCLVYGGCESCQKKCHFCKNCRECPWCSKCHKKKSISNRMGTDYTDYPSYPKYKRRGEFDEIESTLFWPVGRTRNSPQHRRDLQNDNINPSGEEDQDMCTNCPCNECPLCPKCNKRGEFDEIESTLFWPVGRTKSDQNWRNKEKKYGKPSWEGGRDVCYSCPCDVCPLCPQCERRGEFDEIESTLFWPVGRTKSDQNWLNKEKKYGKPSWEGGRDVCYSCPCNECPLCPQCERRGEFDEIESTLFWPVGRTKSDQNWRNIEKYDNTSWEGGRDVCYSCPCDECPLCPQCERRGEFHEIESTLFWPVGRTRKSLRHRRDLQNDYDNPLRKGGQSICNNCPCSECLSLCPKCNKRGEFDEIESTLFWPVSRIRMFQQLLRALEIRKAIGSDERVRDSCEGCSCDECPLCPDCRTREFDETGGFSFPPKEILPNGELQLQEESNRIREASRTRNSNLNNLVNTNLYKKSSLNVGDKSSTNEFDCSEGNEEDCLRLSDYSDVNCLDCMSNIENLELEVDNLIMGNGESCDTEIEKECKNSVNIIRKIISEDGDPSKSTIGTDYDSEFLLKCNDCNDTLDFFMDKLTAEISRCDQESNYNYREVETMCATNEGIIFHMKGCDPETFSRTFDEIRENFLKEFSQFVTADQEHSHKLDHIQSNFGYLLTNIDMLLQEGISLSGVTLGNVLHVTDALMKFKDLKMEFQKRMTELHDFSETDMYDLFSSELSMQNERLGMTSKWLNQLKKLLPWIKKVIRFLGANPKFQEVNERIMEAIRLVSEIGPNVKLVERHRELRNYIQRVKVIEKKEKTTGVGQAILDLKTSFKNTFMKDIFQKAVIMAQNWVFPLTKSYLSIQNIRNETYDAHLAAVSAEIQEYKKSIMLYTTVHAFDPIKNDVPFYEWNIRTRPTLLHDLFSGKPVILVSEILDGGKKNSLMAKDFEVKFVAGRRQVLGTQEEIDNALKGHWVNLTHSGISYFKFGSRIYRRLTEMLTFRHRTGTVIKEKVKSAVDYVLSPYTTWVLRLEPNSSGEYPLHILDKIGSIELVGTGRYVVNCADIPDVNQYFIPLNDYSRRNEK